MNTKPTQAYFLLACPVKPQRLFTHHVNPGSVNPIIGLNVLCSVRPINIEMLENLPIFILNLQEQV